ncbi:MAG: hypothetical protein WCI23_12120 [Chlorobiaceae bacterium]|jgi:mRNA interferase YafQ
MRDYRREKSGIHGKKLDDLLKSIIGLLAEDKALPPNAVDHAPLCEAEPHFKFYPV